MIISNIAQMSGRNMNMVGLALAECACVTQPGGVLVRQWMTGDARALVNIKDSVAGMSSPKQCFEAITAYSYNTLNNNNDESIKTKLWFAFSWTVVMTTKSQAVSHLKTPWAQEWPHHCQVTGTTHAHSALALYTFLKFKSAIYNSQWQCRVLSDSVR